MTFEIMWSSDELNISSVSNLMAANISGDDRNEILYCSDNIYIFEQNNFNEYTVIQSETENYGVIELVDWDGNGTLEIIAGKYNGTIEILDINTLNVIESFPLADEPIFSILPQPITYTNFNSTKTITQDLTSLAIEYGADQQRKSQIFDTDGDYNTPQK